MPAAGVPTVYSGAEYRIGLTNLETRLVWYRPQLHSELYQRRIYAANHKGTLRLPIEELYPLPRTSFETTQRTRRNPSTAS